MNVRLDVEVFERIQRIADLIMRDLAAKTDGRIDLPITHSKVTRMALERGLGALELEFCTKPAKKIRRR